MKQIAANAHIHCGSNGNAGFFFSCHFYLNNNIHFLAKPKVLLQDVRCHQAPASRNVKRAASFING